MATGSGQECCFPLSHHLMGRGQGPGVRGQGAGVRARPVL